MLSLEQMTVLLIPNFLSMLIVAVIVFFVDMALFGFMAIWGLRLNMLTMVILLLAIGKQSRRVLFGRAARRRQRSVDHSQI